jgi:hypothetical protein
MHAARGVHQGPAAGRVDALIGEADLLVNLGGVNRIAPERRRGRPSAYVDFDPGYTQIKVDTGDTQFRTILEEHTHLFTFGENIGTPRSTLPTAGLRWHPTRQPIALGEWADAGPPGRAYTTIGRWDAKGRDVSFAGETYTWRKRPAWLRCLDLPARSGAELELAMDVHLGAPGDLETLTRAGFRVVDPIPISADPWRYRDYIRGSRGEFTVAKDLYVRPRSGWFSDRAACYLAAGRPAIEHDTGFRDFLPLGPGLHAFTTADEAAQAIGEVEADYPRASAHAREVAREHFAADRVLATMLAVIGI